MRRFAAGISVDEAEHERERRWEVVTRARFECWKVGMGVQASTSAGTSAGGVGGLVFRVGAGIEMEREM